MSGLMNVSEFAEALGVTVACIRRWVFERRITTVKVGRLVKIPEGEVQRVVEAGLRPALERGCDEAQRQTRRRDS